MADIKNIFEILLLFSASFLCIMLVYYVMKITKSIDAIRKDFSSIAGQMTPLLDSLNNLSRSIKLVAEDIRYQLDKTNWIVDEVRSKVEGLLNFENKIRETFDHPAQSIMSTIQYVKNGVAGFFKKKSVM